MNKLYHHAGRLLLASLLALPATALADGTREATFLVLHQGGVETAFALSDKPELAFSGDSLVVTSLGDNLTAPLAGLTYDFETRQVTAAIQGATAPGRPTAEPRFAFGEATVSGLNAGAAVSVYQAGGTLVQKATADGSGRVRLDLNSLPKGIYIIKTPAGSLKVTNQ